MVKGRPVEYLPTHSVRIDKLSALKPIPFSEISMVSWVFPLLATPTETFIACEHCLGKCTWLVQFDSSILPSRIALSSLDLGQFTGLPSFPLLDHATHSPLVMEGLKIGLFSWSMCYDPL
jgi:hypothetical protein